MNESLAPSKEDQQNAMLCHLLALAGFVIPFGSIIGPVVMWSLKKSTSPFVDEHGKESINFQITALIAGIICAVLVFVGIGILLGLALLVACVIFVVQAALKANEGQPYRYPVSLRFLK